MVAAGAVAARPPLKHLVVVGLAFQALVGMVLALLWEQPVLMEALQEHLALAVPLPS